MNNNPPDRLSERAKEIWRKLQPLVAGFNMERHGDTLALLCDSWEQYLVAKEHVAEHGQVILSPINGRIFLNPAKRIVDEERKAIVKLSKMLGITSDIDGKSRPPESGNKWNGLLGDEHDE